MMKIPQSNPGASYLAHKSEIDVAIRRVLDSGWYILGKEVDAFESEFAAWLGARHACGVGNGTDAIEIALRACGAGPGDAVFTVAHTAVATVSAIERTGAVPVLVDINRATYTMEPESLEQAIRSMGQGKDRSFANLKAKAIVPVHLYGHPCDMTAILAIARKYGMRVVEDCAQAHGAAIDVQPPAGDRLTTAAKRGLCGTYGDAAAFSFYPTKNLGAIGDGGAVVTNDSCVAERVRLLRQYGWRQRYVSDIPGGNSRLDEVQAAILRVKLQSLEGANARRRQIAKSYDRALADVRLTLPVGGQRVAHVYHQYVVRTPYRDALCAALRREDIGTLIHYPTPIHLQPAYQGRLPLCVPLAETESASREVLSLPMYPELTDEQVSKVCEVIHRWRASNDRSERL